MGWVITVNCLQLRFCEKVVDHSLTNSLFTATLIHNDIQDISKPCLVRNSSGIANLSMHGVEGTHYQRRIGGTVYHLIYLYAG